MSKDMKVGRCAQSLQRPRKTQELRRVLISDAPRYGESLHGYLVRMAERNVYETPQWILAMCGERSINSRTARPLQKLAVVLRRSAAELYSLTLEPQAGCRMGRFLSTTVYAPLLNQGRTKICPQCLEEDPYLRVLWELRPLTCCPRHGVRLIWQCPACWKPLTYTRPKVCECRCGYDLRQSVPSAGDPAELWLSRVFEAKAMGKPVPAGVGEQVVGQLSLDDLARMVVLLGCFSGNVQIGQITKRAVIYGRGPSEWAKVAAAGADVLYGWPGAFKGYLDDLLSRHRRDAANTRFSGAFSRFYSYATRYFAEARFEPILREFAQYIDRFWPEGNIRRHTTGMRHLMFEGPGRMYGKEVARMLGVSRDQLIDMIERNVVTGTVVRSGRKTWIFVEPECLERFDRSSIARVSLKAVRIYLGVSHQVAAALTDAGILEEVFIPRQHAGCRYVSQASVINVAEELKGRLVRKARRQKIVSLGWAMQYVPGGTRWVPQLIKAALAGKIRVVVTDSDAAGLAAFGFERRTITRFAGWGAHGPERPLPLYKAARMLKVRDEITYLLADAGLLQCTASTKGRRARFTTKAEVERFRATYVRASELGRAAGMSAYVARKRLREAGVKPAFCRTGTNRAFYLFRRDNAERVLQIRPQ